MAAGRDTRTGATRRRVVRAAAVAGGLALAFTGGMGFLHTPYGRPLMARLGMSCPAGRLSPAEAEGLRQWSADQLRGARPAPERPALGLALDRAREADALAWARARGVACTARDKPSRMLACSDVPAATAGGAVAAAAAKIDEVVFAFAPDGRLVVVDTFRRQLDGAGASALYGEIAAGLEARLGPATERVGDPSPAYLDGGALHTAKLRYRFSDYLAVVTATNVSGRVVLREQYQSAAAPPTPPRS